MLKLRSLAAWTGGVLVFAAMLLYLALAPVLLKRRSWEPGAKLLCRALARCFGYRVVLAGAEGIEGLGPVVLACNHVNLLDGFLLYGWLPLSFRGVELESHFSWPLYGWLTRRFGNIALDQGGGGRTAGALRTAEETLRSGVSLALFPEGHRTRDGRLRPFMRGAFRLAERTELSLVPVVQRGSWDVLRTGAFAVHPGTVELFVLPPWTPERRAAFEGDSWREAVRAEMEAIYEGKSSTGASA